MAIQPGGSNISQGQRQLICLAQAILSQCRVLILDKSTSGIDSTTYTAIQEIIAKEFAHATVIVIAHKLLTVAGCDAIMVMSEGEVAEFGTPLSFLEKKGQFWNMVSHSDERGEIEAAIRLG